MKATSLLFIFIISILGCTEIPQGVIVDLGDNTQATDDTNPTETLTRPLNQIFIQSGFCACSQGKPINISTSCDSQCSTQPTTETTKRLYLNFNVGAELQNSQFVNVEGYCSQNLIDPDTQEVLEQSNPSCTLVFEDKDTSDIVEVSQLSINSNSLTANALTGVDFNKRYRFYLRENASQTTSDTYDIQLYSDLVDTILDVPLWIEPIYQYACVNITTSTDGNNNNGDVYYDEAMKVHFYYDASIEVPPTITTENDNLICHQSENPIYNTPLIDNTPGQMKLWNKKDPRFADYVDPISGQTISGTLSIDMILKGIIEELGFSLQTEPKLFNRFEYFADPDKASTGTQDLMGYYLIAFKDISTQRHFCPGNSHYTGTDPVFRALREVVNEETQAFYLAKQVGKDDFIFIMEEDVKPAWFYLNESNQEVEPTDETIIGKTIRFYWPIDTVSPRQKKPHQVVYTIQAPSSNNPANTPHDNRVGCVPKI